MPATPEPTPTEILISSAFAMRAEIAKRQLELDQAEADIIALGKGKHTGAEPGHVVTVVAATPASTGAVTYKPLPPEHEEAARKLAGVRFGSLFDRQVIYTPREGFAAIAGAVLTPARARDLVQFCEVPGKLNPGKRSYLLWPK